MRAQELPMSTIVIIAIGVIFLIIFLLAFFNVIPMHNFFSSIFPPSQENTCYSFCSQAQGFDADLYSEENIGNLPYCQNDCPTTYGQCTVLDSRGVIHNLDQECTT